MEYTSPGGVISLWNKVQASFVVTLLTVAVLVNLVGVTQANRPHRRLHHSHYQSDTFNHGQEYYDADYEDSTVMLRPEFLDTRSNVTVIEGMMATLPCAVRYLGTKRVAWRLLGAKDDHFLTFGTFTWVRESNIMVDYKAEEGQISHWDLIIKSVKLSDQGTYECQITDKVPIRTHIRLTVKKRPEREPAVSMTGKEFVERNEKIHLVCNATGGPRIPEEIDWFKDGTKIYEGSGVFMTKYRSLEHNAMISELIIEKADESHTGTYICRSSDKKIVSRKVTVLVADTTNVKRGTASKQDGSFPSSNDGMHKAIGGVGVGGGYQRASKKTRTSHNKEHPPPPHSPGGKSSTILPIFWMSVISVIAAVLLV